MAAAVREGESGTCGHRRESESMDGQDQFREGVLNNSNCGGVCEFFNLLLQAYGCM